MEYHVLIDQLGNKFALPDLVPDADQIARIAFDDVHLALRPVAADTLLEVQAHLGRVADEDTTTIEALLAANFFADGPLGATLALDELGSASMTRRVPLEGLDLDQLLRVLEPLVNHAESWQERLGAIPVAGSWDESTDYQQFDLMRV